MIQLLQLAKREISIENMRQIISSIPYAHEIEDIRDFTPEDFAEWGQRSYCIDCILEANEKIDIATEQAQSLSDLKEELAEKEAIYELIYNYFLQQFPNLPNETRPVIVESFLGLAEPFLSGILKRHFARGINIKPEETHNGEIIVLDFPVKEFLQAGVYAQGIFKYLWQQATERRVIENSPRPVFLWVDEAQLFLSEYDQIFQTTARSSRAATVFISQNISNYYVAIGGSSPKAKADALLANLGTKIFHANNDSVTNNWAAETIGKAFKSVNSISIGKNQNTGISQQLHYLVEPREFSGLKTGGEENDLNVEGVVTIAGKIWSNKLNFWRAFFKQNN